MNVRTGALIVGSNLAAIQAALDLADSGIPVTLVERSPFLGSQEDRSKLPIPLMLQAVKHPNITCLTDAQVTSCYESGTQVQIQRGPRFVDLERCTGCGDCSTVCPMPLLDPSTGQISEQCAVHKPHPQAVPNVYVIDKAGTAPCRNACPIDQRVQGYVALIREGRFAEAYLTIKEENPFPSICGRVCNHRCEEACNRGAVDAPVNVMGLKRFVADWAAEHPEEIAAVTPRYEPEPRGKKVAVVGGGPAGLTCALDLVRLGYEATVFEARPVAGGMMRLGVPDHRLPPEVVQREIDDIVAAGVELVLNHRIDDMGALLEQNYDAVFIAVGAHLGVELPILGADLPDVHLATDYLRLVNLGEPVDVTGKRVMVIGGGNVGLDVAQTAVRTGAGWVGMACLESREKMPAFEWEIRDAEEEGVEIFPCRTFKEIVGASYVDGEWVTGVRCAQVNFRGFVDGRPDLDEISGTEEIIPTDVVVFAVGQWPDLAGTPKGIDKHRGRWLVADKETQVTNLPSVSAGGDVVTGTRFIVDAIAAGHRAAHALDTYLRTGVPAAWSALNPSQEVVELAPQQARAKLQERGAFYAADIPRHELPKLPAETRIKSFQEMYGGFTQEEAIAEARRCLVCGTCSECLACVRVCQANAIDHFQEPESITVDSGVLIWADDEAPPVPEVTEGKVYTLSGENPLMALSVVAQVMVDLAHHRQRVQLRPALAQESAVPQIGVFVCKCGDKIDGLLEVDALVEKVRSLPNVNYAQSLSFACQPEAAALITSSMKVRGLNRAVLAACSCCSLDQVCDSCTFQRVRCKSNLLGIPFQLADLPVEFVNIREQCAWAHRDDPLLAMVKARGLIAAAAARASLLTYPPRPTVEIEGRVLVLGEGEAAVICANALRMQGLAVAQSEEIPVAIEGSLGQFTITLYSDNWRWQVEASVLVLAPAQEAQMAHITPRPGLFFCSVDGDAELVAKAVATKVGVLLGSGQIIADYNVAQVDSSRCVGCGTCESVCEYLAVSLVEVSDPVEPDPISTLMGTSHEEGARMLAQVNPALCQGCGTCAAHCPSNAIAAGCSTDKQLEAMLAVMLEKSRVEMR